MYPKKLQSNCLAESDSFEFPIYVFLHLFTLRTKYKIKGKKKALFKKIKIGRDQNSSGLHAGRVLPTDCCYPKKAEVNNISTDIPTATHSTGQEILHCKESLVTHQLVIWDAVPGSFWVAIAGTHK